MSIHLIFTVAAVFGSYLVIRAFHKFHSLRTASNVILVSLSTADGLLAIPLIFGIVQMSLRLLNGSNAECSSGPLGKITFISNFFRRLLENPAEIHFGFYKLNFKVKEAFGQDNERSIQYNV